MVPKKWLDMVRRFISAEVEMLFEPMSLSTWGALLDPPLPLQKKLAHSALPTLRWCVRWNLLGLQKKKSRKCYGMLMFHGFSMVFPCFFHGFSMVFPHFWRWYLGFCPSSHLWGGDWWLGAVRLRAMDPSAAGFNMTYPAWFLHTKNYGKSPSLLIGGL